jgi:hypothetical protein
MSAIKPHKGGRTEVINFRCTPETKNNLYWLADQEQISAADLITKTVEEAMFGFDARTEASDMIDSESVYSTEDAKEDGLSAEQYAEALLHTYDGPEREDVHKWMLYYLEPHWQE